MAFTMSDVVVTGVSTEQEFNAVGASIDLVRVYYTIGDTGPYSVVIPKLDLTSQRVLMDVRADAQKYLDILNLTF